MNHVTLLVTNLWYFKQDNPSDRIVIAITCVSNAYARKNDIVAVRFYTTALLNVHTLQCFILN